MKSRKLCLIAPLLAIGMSAWASPGGKNPAIPRRQKQQAASTEKQTQQNDKGKWGQDKQACHDLDGRSKELLAQEKQLHQQGKQLESQEVGLRRQAKAIEQQRLSLEHSHRGVGNSTGTESELRSLEAKRVSLEHQADGISKQREQLEHQANEIGKERRSLEEQHKSTCGGFAHGHSKHA